MNYASINVFLKMLDRNKNKLSSQQYKTLRGQAIRGDVSGAQKGLGRLLRN